MGSKVESEFDVNVYPGMGYRCYYDLRLSRGRAQMLYSIDNMLGVLFTECHGNIRTYSGSLNMNSTGLLYFPFYLSQLGAEERIFSLYFLLKMAMAKRRYGGE